MSGAGMMDCKGALAENNNDLEAASVCLCFVQLYHKCSPSCMAAPLLLYRVQVEDHFKGRQPAM